MMLRTHISTSFYLVLPFDSNNWGEIESLMILGLVLSQSILRPVRKELSFKADQL